MDNIYNITQAAKILGFKVKTLQKWDREGRLVPAYRTPTNRRVYTESQLRKYKNSDYCVLSCVKRKSEARFKKSAFYSS